MPSTHLALYYHVVFSTKERFPFITNEARPDLFAYLGGCAITAGAQPVEIGGMSDHVHILLEMPATVRLSDIVGDLKRSSSQWMKEEKGVPKFAWQTGYGAFTVGASQKEKVRAYVRGQEEHHKTKTFQEEYLEFLEKSGVEYKPEYLW